MLLLVVRASKDTSAGMLHNSHQQRERKTKTLSLTHIHTHSHPFTLLLHSTSSTRMLAIALIKAVNERNIHIKFLLSRFKLTAYITPKDKIQSVTECVIILTSLQFT